MRTLGMLLTAAGALWGAGPGVIESLYIAKNFTLAADPDAKPWKGVTAVRMDNDRYGKLVPGHRTEIRSRWTRTHIYFLFSCEYRDLNLKPSPSLTSETNRLWEYDVAEVFVGSDYKNIHLYKEFQVSPQGEWVDLEIDTLNRSPDAWRWNSGFEVMARIDKGKRWWYGEMKIPFPAIDKRLPRDGLELRLNFYRLQGPGKGPNRVGLAWQPTHADNNHAPERFGTLRLRQ